MSSDCKNPVHMICIRESLQILRDAGWEDEVEALLMEDVWFRTGRLNKSKFGKVLNVPTKVAEQFLRAMRDTLGGIDPTIEDADAIRFPD